jgi:acetyl esterase/lipase
VGSVDIGLVRELIELQAPLRAAPLADRRRQYDRAESTFGRDDPQGDVVDAGGCPAEWVRPQRDGAQPVVVYVHGGGYSLGSTRSHRHLAASIGRAADAAVLSLDYRLAPECCFPAAVDDTSAAVSWLLERSDALVVLAGDSAGGGLVVASMVALRDAGRPMPAAGVCMSPWFDLSCRASAHVRLAQRDPVLTQAELRRMADWYLRDADAREPLASPAFADLARLPPLLIQAGTEEILLDDARALADAARAVGVDVSLQEWPEMTHAWQWYFPILEEGRQAIASIAAFIGERVKRQEPRASTPDRRVPATPTQEAHLAIAPSTSGRGFLSWVYQLNGGLDPRALALAIDDVVRRHEILRVRFERRDERLWQRVPPFAPGVMKVTDLGNCEKGEGLGRAIADVREEYAGLSPSQDAPLRATLYTIDRKTCVLAMFVAEALVDSDSGSLLSAEISRAYAEHAGCAVPSGLPAVSATSFLEHAASQAPDPVSVSRARKHWLAQEDDNAEVQAWLEAKEESDADGSGVAFQMTPDEWAEVVARARSLRTSPYVLVLTCLQAALAQVAGVRRCLVHAIVSQRGDDASGIIGNFHGMTRVELRFEPGTGLERSVVGTATAVATAVEHAVYPAVLAGAERSVAVDAGDRLPAIRFYMFDSHEGPVFAGIRRRRFRLHGAPPAPLSISCVRAADGRRDFAVSSSVGNCAATQPLSKSLERFLFLCTGS